ncbi:MAG: cytochrome c [Saprospiraceae bacterium]
MMSDVQKIGVATILTTCFLAYTFFLYSSLPMKKVFESSIADKGKLVWQEKNCNACHQVYGLGGFLGPDLTNEYSLKGPDVIKAFLISGTATMPSFHLTAEETLTLLAYMQHMDSTGHADPRSFIIRNNGTITQK